MSLSAVNSVNYVFQQDELCQNHRSSGTNNEPYEVGKGALLNMLAEVASQKLFTETNNMLKQKLKCTSDNDIHGNKHFKKRSHPSNYQNNLAKKFSEQQHNINKGMRSCYMTTQQIQTMSASQLVRMFTKLDGDEMKKTFYFQCNFYLDCKERFFSFGSEEKAKHLVKQHLINHVNDLKSDGVVKIPKKIEECNNDASKKRIKYSKKFKTKSTKEKQKSVNLIETIKKDQLEGNTPLFMYSDHVSCGGNNNSSSNIQQIIYKNPSVNKLNCNNFTYNCNDDYSRVVHDGSNNSAMNSDTSQPNVENDNENELNMEHNYYKYLKKPSTAESVDDCYKSNNNNNNNNKTVSCASFKQETVSYESLEKNNSVLCASVNHELKQDYNIEVREENDVPYNNYSNDEFHDYSVNGINIGNNLNNNSEEININSDGHVLINLNGNNYVANNSNNVDVNNSDDVTLVPVISVVDMSVDYLSAVGQEVVVKTENNYDGNDSSTDDALEEECKGDSNEHQTSFFNMSVENISSGAEVPNDTGSILSANNIEMQNQFSSSQHSKKKPKGKAKFIGQSTEEREMAVKMIKTVKKGGGKLECQICRPPRLFTAPTTLISHYRSHAGIKPYECNLCKAVFTRQHSLNYHLLIHMNQTRFTCEVCGRKFRHPSHFKEHQRRHTGESPFQCPDCPYRFKTRNTYKRHLKTRHGKILTHSGNIIDDQNLLAVTKISDITNDNSDKSNDNNNETYDSNDLNIDKTNNKRRIKKQHQSRRNKINSEGINKIDSTLMFDTDTGSANEELDKENNSNTIISSYDNKVIIISPPGCKRENNINANGVTVFSDIVTLNGNNSNVKYIHQPQKCDKEAAEDVDFNNVNGIKHHSSSSSSSTNSNIYLQKDNTYNQMYINTHSSCNSNSANNTIVLSIVPTMQQQT